MHEEETQMPHGSRVSEVEPLDYDVSMEEWLDGHEHRVLRRGEIVRGQVVYAGDDALLVDVGAKSEGVVPRTDLERSGSADTIAEGDTVLVYCVTPEDRSGNILLSISKAQIARDWERAHEMYDSGEVFQSKVAGHNKGGVIVYVGEVRGFVPASQLAHQRRGQYRDKNAAQPWSELIGEELWLKVIECDAEQNRLILSEQAARRQRRKAMRAELLAKLAEGDIVTGEVTSLADFGAFVDLGGADGLIHVSELSWERVRHPSDVLSIGDEVEVQVISIDDDRKRIGLSMKRLQAEPWSMIGERYQVGDLVQGTVTKLTVFGAFARIDGGVEGLIHISELADRPVNHPSEVVKPGDEVTLRIIRIEPERRRIGLSLRQAEEETLIADDQTDAAEVEDQSDQTDGEIGDYPEQQEELGEHPQPEAVLEKMADSDVE